MHICPENTTELMALKYWMKEYLAHGPKMLEVCETVEKGREVFKRHNPEEY